jgi:hypothetical protein
MTQYVVDVCIAVKWFVPEKYSQNAAWLLKGLVCSCRLTLSSSCYTN